MRGFIDGKLVTDSTYDPYAATATSVFATATYAQADHTVIIKVVNAGKTPVDASISLRGAGGVEPTGTAIVLTGDPRAVNTVDEPQKVSPKQEKLDGAAPSFRRTFAPYSFTILRLTTAAPRDEKQQGHRP